MATTYLTRTQSNTGSETKGTFSAWIKRSKLGSIQVIFSSKASTDFFAIEFDASDKFQANLQINGTDYLNLKTTRVLRDTSGWYNLVVAIDSTDSTQADRVKMYVNGVRETSFSTNLNNVTPSLNMRINSSSQDPYIGSFEPLSAQDFGGSMSHIHWVDGTAYPASTFGSTDSTTGEWEINTSPSITYGTNGFFILKDGNSVTDQSGKGNDFTVAAGTLTKTEDCPSNVFATMNRASPTTAVYTNMANGNLYNGDQSPNYWNSIPGTLAASSGKFYWEVKIEGVWGNTSQTSQRHGIANLNVDLNQKVGSTGDVTWTDDPIAVGWQNSSGVRYSNSVTGTSDYSTYVATNVLMFAMDLTNLKLYLGKNGAWENSGDPTSGASGTGAYTIPVAGIWTPYSETKYGSDVISWNCGNGHFRTTTISPAGSPASTPGIFQYQIPTGYQPMSTKGLNA